jgi:hypothetical protein
MPALYVIAIVALAVYGYRRLVRRGWPARKAKRAAALAVIVVIGLPILAVATSTIRPGTSQPVPITTVPSGR